MLTADLALAGVFASAADLADAAFFALVPVAGFVASAPSSLTADLALALFFVLVLLTGSSASAADLEALLVFLL